MWAVHVWGVHVWAVHAWAAHVWGVHVWGVHAWAVHAWAVHVWGVRAWERGYTVTVIMTVYYHTIARDPMCMTATNTQYIVLIVIKFEMYLWQF